MDTTETLVTLRPMEVPEDSGFRLLSQYRDQCRRVDDQCGSPHSS